jgi:hypothetical protein
MQLCIWLHLLDDIYIIKKFCIAKTICSWLDEAQRFREREQWYAREKALIGDLEGFGDRAFSRIGEAMTQMALEGKDAWESLRNVGKAVLSELYQETFRFAVLNPLKNLLLGQNNPTLDDVFSHIGGVISGWFGGGSAVADARAFNAFGIYHAGGVVGDGTAPTRGLPIGLLAGARRYHGGGWAGLEPDEVPAILQRGEAVLSRRQVATLAGDNRNSGGAPVTVIMNISTPDAAGFRMSQGQIAADALRAMERARRNI